MCFHELGFHFDIKNIGVLRLANLICFDYACECFSRGSGYVPAGFLVFKTCGGSRCGPRWVRLPSTPARSKLIILLDKGTNANS